MHIEQLEIVDFLKNCTPPLTSLPLEDIHTLVSVSETVYLRAHKEILTAGDSNDTVYLIRKGSIALKDLTGQVTSQIDSGSWFGFSVLFQKGVMQSSISSLEDCLLYAFPLTTIQELMAQHQGVKSFFSEQKSNRLHQAIIDYRGDSQTQLIQLQK